jgi:CDP-diacylglycerol---glycerol-3-phosphate 3-phosphatidyltransferase
VEQTAPKKKTFTENMRIWFKGIVEPIAAFLNRIGLTPNSITLTGLAGNILGAILLAKGYFLWGGILVLLMGPLDALDGTMARLRGEASEWGAFVDSVTDRYSELIIFGGLVYYYAGQPDTPINTTLLMLTFAAAAGSVLVSYTKARADSLKYNANIGVLTRMERYMILAPALVLGIPAVAIVIVALLANITAIQRIWKVRSQAHARRNQS